MTVSADKIFLLMNQLALVGWILLIGFPRWRGTGLIVRNGALSIAMSVVYVLLVVCFVSETDGGFGTLEQVGKLFDHPYALLAGWVHYLAFDLFIGAWISKDAEVHHIKHRYLIPVLILTFMLGPAGLLLYFILRKGFEIKGR